MTDGHSFGPTCVFYEPHADHSTSEDLVPPTVKAQFFYASSLPIDDPLAVLPPIGSEKNSNQSLQPFSRHDNAALEEAWQNYQIQREEFKARPGSRGLHRMFSFPKFRSGQVLDPELTSPTFQSPTTSSIQPAEQRLNPTQMLRRKRSSRMSSRSSSPEVIRKASIKGVVPHLKESQVLLAPSLSDGPGANNVAVNMKQIEEELDTGTIRRSVNPSPTRRRNQGNNDDQDAPSDSPERVSDQARHGPRKVPSTASLQPEHYSTISGRPFARVPSTRQLMSDTFQASPLPSPQIKRSEASYFPPQKIGDKKRLFTPVGASRLHLVEIPELVLKPIYWSPVNDSSNVLRATWFYKATMLPVPADIANRLEIGYEDMRPYSSTYQDELLACVEHGPVAEMKIVYKLWPEDRKTSRPTTAEDTTSLHDASNDEGEPRPKEADNAAFDPHQEKRSNRDYRNYGVIYTDAKNAQILRPNALPSVSRNRAPLSSVRKGRDLGIAVVRGFDRSRWDKMHPSSQRSEIAEVRLPKVAKSGAAITQSQASTCPICDADTKRATVTDLVLVIHGIGQKLSERVDSYHFTHAINGLRRDFNVQASQPGVRKISRDDAEIMVLPVNWRLTVSFDDKPKTGATQNNYELKDITPDTLPAVRSIISDVMLDIPYYMSHHKQKMIAAVVREANRVYRLWCRNNPGFENYGKVHLIAHSLGSAMAVDILSHQPTIVPPLNLAEASQDSDEKHFEFNTTNFFCCGSPSGFFLLLHNANLLPRQGRQKKGMDFEDAFSDIACEDTKYGCLAVDNVYNVMHKNDPVAYQQNACVDSAYAATLQPALIPSTTQSFYSQIFGSIRGTTPQDAYSTKSNAVRPPTAQLPSTVELETHNFTREEIAEKRMYLLNDNGQIDYFLQSHGGPLEIQYLNMLSAHSSYWYLSDFARFLVVEIGREPGRDNTIPALRAVKKRTYKRGGGI